jgi:hypothetical protein
MCIRPVLCKPVCIYRKRNKPATQQPHVGVHAQSQDVNTPRYIHTPGARMDHLRNMRRSACENSSRTSQNICTCSSFSVTPLRYLPCACAMIPCSVLQSTRACAAMCSDKDRKAAARHAPGMPAKRRDVHVGAAAHAPLQLLPRHDAQQRLRDDAAQARPIVCAPSACMLSTLACMCVHVHSMARCMRIWHRGVPSISSTVPLLCGITIEENHVVFAFRCQKCRRDCYI